MDLLRHILPFCLVLAVLLPTCAMQSVSKDQTPSKTAIETSLPTPNNAPQFPVLPEPDLLQQLQAVSEFAHMANRPNSVIQKVLSSVGLFSNPLGVATSNLERRPRLATANTITALNRLVGLNQLAQPSPESQSLDPPTTLDTLNPSHSPLYRLFKPPTQGDNQLDLIPFGYRELSQPNRYSGVLSDPSPDTSYLPFNRFGLTRPGVLGRILHEPNRPNNAMSNNDPTIDIRPFAAALQAELNPRPWPRRVTRTTSMFGPKRPASRNGTIGTTKYYLMKIQEMLDNLHQNVLTPTQPDHHVTSYFSGSAHFPGLRDMLSPRRGLRPMMFGRTGYLPRHAFSSEPSARLAVLNQILRNFGESLSRPVF